MKHSALYVGQLGHRRFLPREHQFSYPIFQWYLDLDELEEVFKGHWYTSLNRWNILSFRREDYLDPHIPDLKEAVILRLAETPVLAERVHSVRLLTHVRYFNFTFNPVSFYYCFDKEERLCAVLAEITNTPWNERHTYVLPIIAEKDLPDQQADRRRHEFDFDKAFHVSPFNPMNMRYRWVLSEPGAQLSIFMENRIKSSTGEGEKHFDALLRLDRKNIDENLGPVLIRQPLMTVKVVFGIYWQAMRLWLKRIPFYDHPTTLKEP